MYNAYVSGMIVSWCWHGNTGCYESILVKQGAALMDILKNKKRRVYSYCISFMTGLVCLLVLPLFVDLNLAEQYYQIIVGENAYGCYESAKEATEELNKVRRKLERNQKKSALVTVTCSVEPVKKVLKTSGSVEEDLYNTLANSIEKEMQEAYTIKVNEFTVTVASEGAVIETLQTIKRPYDARDCYEITLESSGSAVCLTPVFHVREEASLDGLKDMEFQQNIEIIQAYVDESEIVNPVSAAAALTKEWETPTIYTVEKGDCLSVIAEKHQMKTKDLAELNLIEDPDEINIGDNLVVTVPMPEISVSYKIQAAYEEEYKEEIQYIDNSSWYVGTEVVVQEGTTGKRHVVADIVYSDDKEVGRNILEETILKEAKPRIVERGTSTPPTYIKPLVGGRFSSPYGSRWGRMHKGVDWACSVGTAIKASSGGTVASAGWVNGYGYCITISHPDGKKTRYAHLSKILVSAGERVKQGEKIALSGNTGNSTGPHLHFEILVNGVQVNPFKYME